MADLSARLEAVCGGDPPAISLSLVLTGSGDAAIFQPLVPMDISVATVAGDSVRVHVPPLDLGIQRRVVTAPAVVPSPVRLVFAPESADPFAWAIDIDPAHAARRGGLVLWATMQIDGDATALEPVIVSVA